MEHTGNISARASTDERASPSIPAVDDRAVGPPSDPQFASEAEEKAYWDGVTHGLRCLTGENRRDDDEPPGPRDSRGEAAEILGSSHRRPRQDGWLPWKKARFLLVLVAGGVVADACRAVGMSVASAYALKNRRSGRAFGKMWDAIMVHRARSRLADNNLSRAMNGCVDQVLRDGIVVAERRRFDNRLSMAMLTRLDRIAESKTGEEAALLRALSEDFEDYLDVVEAGGDEEAFLEARRPAPDAAGEAPANKENRSPEADGSVAMEMRDWSLVDPAEIPVDGLDPNRMFDWSADERRRAELSHYLDWLDSLIAAGGEIPRGPDLPAAFDRHRRQRPIPAAEPVSFNSPELAGARDGPEAGGGGLHESEELFHPASHGHPPQRILGRDEDAWQASTSSTSPPGLDANGGGKR